MSMRLRLILSFFLVVVVAIASVMVIGRLNTAEQVNYYMFRGGMTNSGGLVTSLENYYAQSGSWQGVEAVITNVHMGGGAGSGRRQGMGGMMNQRIRLVDVTGKLVVDTSGQTSGGTIPQSELNNGIVLHDSKNRTIGFLLVDGGTAFLPGDEIPLITRLNDAALQAGLIALAIALILAVVLSSNLINPIRRLTVAAQKLSSGEKNLQVPVKGRDELATLGRAFNDMTLSLKHSEEQRQAMTADIAHELRTPLAVQRAHLEALQDGVFPLSVENIQPILEQNVLLTRLVEDLRTLALADAGELHLYPVPVVLIELLQGIRDQFAPTTDVQLRLTIDSQVSQSHLIIEGDPDRLAQIMNNLLSNALRYTPPGGDIKITLKADVDRAVVSVHDSGPGIPQDALPLIFDRFYRADSARNRSDGGSGLGLAIARQLALAHGGNLTAENAPEGGAVFVLSLPLKKT